ncbi:hypothetical protein LXM94_00745 [Rhizobium sp. TRM95111]|uniref:hypothetical protein n=1 Tax=Rhizobium alarense TaxID=2846851 RepID=UPI001F250527|nr:hypothetical protein [Rhizobium alarense]MCF3638494.1 hypothetical protein [Rhizobium alarense]
MPLTVDRLAAFAAMLLAAAPAFAAEFDHNGSRMEIDYEKGAIVYRTVKSSLAGFVRPGFVAFTGRIEKKGSVEGTAFTFRRSCEPAPYPVAGHYDPALPGYVLTGASPVREKNGCGVTGYTIDSPNARLEFVDLAPADAETTGTGDAQPNAQGPGP